MKLETNRHRHVSEAAFLRRLTGSCSEEERSHIDAHATRCSACRGLYQGLALAQGEGSAEEEALIAALQRSVPTTQLVARLLAQPADGLAATDSSESRGEAAGGRAGTPACRQRQRSRGREPRPVRWGGRRLSLGVAAAAAVAMLSIVSTRGPAADSSSQIFAATIQLDARAIEGRSALFAGYAPYAAHRGDLDEEALEAARREATLAREAAERIGGSSLAGFYLYHGQPGSLELAERTLEELPEGPERNNDEALVLLIQGSTRQAVALLQRVVERAPDLLAARFNLALALEATGDPKRATAAWENYLLRATQEVTEEAWIEEAVVRLAQLRGQPSG